MNDWERNHRTAHIYKDAYPPGTRVLLIHNNDIMHQLPDGLRGTVLSVDDQGQINCSWDNGSQRRLVPDVDEFRKLNEEELKEEQRLATEEYQEQQEETMQNQSM